MRDEVVVILRRHLSRLGLGLVVSSGLGPGLGLRLIRGRVWGKGYGPMGSWVGSGGVRPTRGQWGATGRGKGWVVKREGLGRKLAKAPWGQTAPDGVDAGAGRGLASTCGLGPGGPPWGFLTLWSFI